jgi:hypothetical protein
MDHRERAVAAMRRAEQEMRAIITDATKAQAYGDVAAVANLANSLSDLIRQMTSGAQFADLEPMGKRPIKLVGAEWPDDVRATPAEHAAVVHRSTSTKPRRDQYPMFLREGDRLVKIAWSKKEKRPYEHRAPRDVVDRLIDRIHARYKQVGEGRVFEAADVMPVKSGTGEEYPSYQAYLALNWLRHVGAITRKGREGYVLKRGAAAPDKLERLWNETPVYE